MSGTRLYAEPTEALMHQKRETRLQILTKQGQDITREGDSLFVVTITKGSKPELVEVF